jgi:hypothetical protein
VLLGKHSARQPAAPNTRPRQVHLPVRVPAGSTNPCSPRNRRKAARQSWSPPLHYCPPDTPSRSPGAPTWNLTHQRAPGAPLGKPTWPQPEGGQTEAQQTGDTNAQRGLPCWDGPAVRSGMPLTPTVLVRNRMVRLKPGRGRRNFGEPRPNITKLLQFLRGSLTSLQMTCEGATRPLPRSPPTKT